MTDPIADMLVRLQNAARAGKASVLIPYSMLKHEIAKVLESAGYVKNISVQGKKVRKFLGLDLVAKVGMPTIRGFKRLSKPSRRLYVKNAEIRPVLQGTGLLVVSTPQGVLRGEDAKKEGLGGEALFMIW